MYAKYSVGTFAYVLESQAYNIIDMEGKNSVDEAWEVQDIIPEVIWRQNVNASVHAYFDQDAHH